MLTKRKYLLLVLGYILLVLYLGSYYVLSRRGYAEAKRWNLRGFYYITPEDSASWQYRNYACVYLYWPLNVADRWVGSGKAPACPPLFGLSK
jgi:hypothetical protein